MTALSFDQNKRRCIPPLRKLLTPLPLAASIAVSLVGCGAEPDTEQPDPMDANRAEPALETAPETRVLVMACEQLNFVAEISGRGAYLFLPDYSGLLPRAVSASGARYEGDGIVFWTRGEEAMLDYQGQSYRGCVNNRQAAIWEAAKLRGVDFRGVGNEPGWVLEIQGDQLELITRYGSERHRFAAASMATDPVSKVTHYRAENADTRIAVSLEGKPCRDSMADISYSTDVSIILGELELQGCGRALH